MLKLLTGMTGRARPARVAVSLSCLITVLLFLVLGQWSYAATPSQDTTTTTTTTSEALTVTTTEALSTVTVTTTQFSCALSLGVCPFVRFLGVSPDPPQVYDMVGLTVHIQSDEAYVRRLDWAFLRSTLAVEWAGSAPLNQSGSFDYTIYHAFSYPGDYYLRVGILDAQNRTAQDVHSLYVDRQSTQLELLVTPQNLNTTQQEQFTLITTLRAVTGAPIEVAPILFSYSSDAENWLPIDTVKTDERGQAKIAFKPPFDGVYQFQVSFAGDEFHRESEAYSFDSLATPEFQYALLLPAVLGLVALVLPIVQPRKKQVWQKTSHEPSHFLFEASWLIRAREHSA